ncbi:MAG: hypothetical protein Fur0022_08980 [Anaerolineales bacterium]
MKGDFSRNTFDRTHHFARVLMQQGRVFLDADWNEQTAILLHTIRTLASDLIGPHGGPGESFQIVPRLDERNIPIAYDFGVKPGNYYVNGLLCENDSALPYREQPNYPLGDLTLKANQSYLVYLDVWERHLTSIQIPEVREVALGGPDTTTRAKVVWQVKAQEYGGECPEGEAWENLVKRWQPEHRGLLRAGVEEFDGEMTDPCIISPESRYRGAENQLYRVEVHRGGTAWDGKTEAKGNPVGNALTSATFKWSRENGAVTFPILKMSGNTVILEHLGRDERLSLHPGDWVEVTDDVLELRGETYPLYKVQSVDRDARLVFLEVSQGDPLPYYDEDPPGHPYLRRWDYQIFKSSSRPPASANDGALLIQEGKTLQLEDGIQITFDASPGEAHSYRTGDYWLIPARTATGDVEWPGERNAPDALPPQGVEHHYAPLAIISVQADGNVLIEKDCRCSFLSLCELTYITNRDNQ